MLTASLVGCIFTNNLKILGNKSKHSFQSHNKNIVRYEFIKEVHIMNSHLYYPSKHKTSPQFCFDVEDSRPTLKQNLGQCLLDPGTADNDVNWINCFKIKKVIHNRCRFTFNVQYRLLQVQIQKVHV